MTDYDYEKLIDSKVSELPKEIVPPRDLWAGIDHAIELRADDQSVRKNRAIKTAAVAAFVMVGCAWFLMGDFNSSDNTPSEVHLTKLINDIDKGFKLQKANVLAVYEGQPALTSTWEEQLKELELARSGIWEALKENPDNVYMIQILLEVQQQQLDLVESVHNRLNRDI